MTLFFPIFVNCFIFGDFNLPNANWMADPEGGALLTPFFPLDLRENAQEIVSNFTDDCADMGLYQVNNIQNTNFKILDLVFTDVPELTKISAADTFLFKNSIHHSSIEIQFYVDQYNESSVRGKKVPDFRKIDDTQFLNLIMNYNWSNFYNITDVESSCSLFYSVLKNFLSMCVPFKNSFSESESPKWFNKEVKKLRNFKTKLYRRYLTSNSVVDYLKYSSVRRELHAKTKSNYHLYLLGIKNQIKSDPKKFWQFVNNKKKTNNFPTQMTYNNHTASDPTTICDIFAIFFQTVYKKPKPCDTSCDTTLKRTCDNPCNNTCDKLNCDNNCDKIENYLKTLESFPQLDVAEPIFEETDIIDHVLKLDDSSSYGPDEIPPFIVKRFISVLARPLCYLFNLSIRTGVFPNVWKSSYVVPLFKNGNKCNIANYRGIVKLSCIPKLFEKLVLGIIEERYKIIISPNQHGFMKNKSTATNLMEFCSDVITKNQNGFQTDVAYLDFSKAFDRVHHKLLLKKLLRIGFPTWFLTWLESYLYQRTQHVCFKNEISKKIIVHSGVPQGSHIGPFLFLIFINDLNNIINHSHPLLFADDVKLRLSFKNYDEHRLLQEDLNTVSTWCDINDMELNVSKCKCMTFTRKNSPFVNTYLLCGQPLQRVDNMCDLGVLMDSKLNFNMHIDYIINKAKSRLGFVCRFASEFKDPYILKTLYCSLVRSCLEYCSCVWSPSYRINITRLESVQKRFLLYALRNLPWDENRHLPPYAQRLNLINLPSLIHRRTISSVLFVFNILTGETDSNYLLSQICINSHSRSLRSVDFIYQRFNRTIYGSHEPLYAACTLFNKYFNLIDFNVSKSCLKTKLYIYLQSQS